MMTNQLFTFEATYEGGVLKPAQPLPLNEQQRVTVTMQLSPTDAEWPADAAAVYQELAEDDKRLAATMWQSVQETWPPSAS
ncbi:MAG TPA: antitoxin family protein [Gemmataceae bacterium]|nr:antitoxin family protein [Gemmataceae bacterium]